MPLKPRGKPQRGGEEWYERTLEYTAEEAAAIQGTLKVERIILHWTRIPGQKWERNPYKSVVIGRERGVAQIGRTRPPGIRSRQIFTHTLTELRSWTVVLPGLRNAVDELESELPE